jgi:hypothetical protein
MRLFPGSYMATADMADGPTKIVQFQVAPAAQQKNIVVKFATILDGAPLGRR